MARRVKSYSCVPIQAQVDALTTAPFHCPNCDDITGLQLFCSTLCKDEAKYVRYFRACIDDGRSEKRDVQAALRTRLAHILGGGYSERLRWLSKTTRQAVIARDKGLCVKCGQIGDQIDHIRGNSGDLSNLQLLCRACHQIKTESSFVSISRASHPAAFAKRDGLLLRVYAIRPELACDDYANWEVFSKSIRASRRKLMREKKDRCSGKRCPVCLAALRKNSHRKFLRTRQVRPSSCSACLSQFLIDGSCLSCGAASVWANDSAAACQSCGIHGTNTRVMTIES